MSIPDSIAFAHARCRVYVLVSIRQDLGAAQRVPEVPRLERALKTDAPEANAHVLRNFSCAAQHGMRGAP